MIIYTICLVLGLVFTLLSATIGHFFGGHDAIGTGGQADAGFDSDGVPGITFFSPMVLATLVTAFGGFGLIFSEIPATSEAWLHAPLSFVAALSIALLVCWAMNKFFGKSQGSSEARVANLIGTSASLATPIPEGGVGEISYVYAGSRYSAPARSETGQAIGAGQPVKITRIVGTQYFVAVAN